MPIQVSFQRFNVQSVKLFVCCCEIMILIERQLKGLVRIIVHNFSILMYLQYKYLHKMEEKQDNDLMMPLTYKNRFAKLIFTNKAIDKLAYKPTILCLALGFIVFFIISVYMFAAMGSIQVINLQYYTPGGSVCQTATTCILPFNITETLQPPIYVMYQLQNFYQNQRLFIQSKSNKQLTGSTITQQQAKICYPYITNGQINASLSWTGAPLNPNEVASPCGMFPYAFFNDTYSITHNGQIIPIDQTGISWPGDQGGKYKRALNSNTTQWIDPENEHFIVWMRAAGIPNFKKMWGKIHRPLVPDSYELHVSNNYRLKDWEDNKYLILSTVSSVGGQNYLLPVQMFLVSLCSLVGAIYLARKAVVYTKLQTQ